MKCDRAVKWNSKVKYGWLPKFTPPTMPPL
jgi:hypothetical protein